MKYWFNGLAKLAQVRWTNHQDMTMAVDWDFKHQTKQKEIG